MTEHELGDSSEAARARGGLPRPGGAGRSPLAYLLFILICLLQYEAASMIRRSNFRNALTVNSARRFRSTDEGHFKGTKFVRESPLGVETSKCSTGGGGGMNKNHNISAPPRRPPQGPRPGVGPPRGRRGPSWTRRAAR